MARCTSAATSRSLTPEAAVFDTEVTYVEVPTFDGLRGFLAHHAPLLTQLGTGKLVLRLPNESKRIFQIEGGFLQMNNNRLSLLSEKAVEQ